MLSDNAGVAATSVAAGQDPAELSPQNPPVETPVLKVETPAEPKVEGKKEVEPEKETSKSEPFNRHPAFQRMSRKNAKLSTQVEAQRDQISEMSGLMKEMLAHQKGETYEPEKKGESGFPDPQDVFDQEMDSLLAKEDLTPEQEVEVQKIAKKYATDLGDDLKAFMPASVAYQLLKDTQGKAEPKPAVQTRPSTTSTEANVGTPGAARPPAKSIAEGVRRAQARAATMERANL